MTFDPEAADDHQPKGPLWRVTLDYGRALSEEEGRALFDGFEDKVLSVFLENRDATDGNHWRVVLTTDGAPDLDALHACAAALVPLPRTALTAELLPEEDWLLHVHRHFPPIRAARFFIFGSHYAGEKPEGFIPLHIDAATAFGSGEHETTHGCLQALADLAETAAMPRRILDMGCGSGILAIAALRLWPEAEALCIDIDPESIVVTHRHASLNGVGARLAGEAGDGYAAPRVAERAPYDLVLANILAGPLVAMARDAAAATAPGGCVILSGLLGRQENEVRQAHVDAGLLVKDTLALGDWRTLVFEKPLG